MTGWRAIIRSNGAKRSGRTRSTMITIRRGVIFIFRALGGVAGNSRYNRASSMTSSARASTKGGIVSQRALKSRETHRDVQHGRAPAGHLTSGP